MTNITLYQLASEVAQVQQQLDDLDLDDQTIADTLESIALPFEQKATSVAAFARNLEATAAQIKEAEGDMAKRRKAIENRAAQVRRYLFEQMQRAGISKIESPLFVLSIKNNPESVVIDDERQIPVEYLRQPEPPPPTPDKVLMKQAMKDGFEIPGARLDRTKRLDIK